MTIDEVVHLIEKKTEAPGAGVRFARDCGVSVSFLSAVKLRKKRPSKKILDALNLKKQVRYVRTTPDHSTTRTLRIMAGQTTESEDHNA